MAPTIVHQGLRAIFKGVLAGHPNQDVAHFNGIPYGKIPKRFAKPEPVTDFSGVEVDCTNYGPRCPQVSIDLYHLLRVPTSIKPVSEDEDELSCLNLNITLPAWKEGGKPSEPLPVLFWIHGIGYLFGVEQKPPATTVTGGSQVVTYCSPGSRVCDTTTIAAQSSAMGKPIVFVTFNYRLNIFGFGNGTGEVNLALKDQRLAIEWVQRNIREFGGDPDNVTLAGESAGAVYTHAHLFMNAPVRRAILASGSLFLSQPRPLEIGTAFATSFAEKVEKSNGSPIERVPASAIVEQLASSEINSLWIQAEPALEDWKSRAEDVSGLMIGDVGYESVIWRNGVELLSADDIVAAFNKAPIYGREISESYGIVGDRPTSSKLGALEFINDLAFALPANDIAQRWRVAGKAVYQYTIDQTNPWQSSAGAHHAVDLIMLFGGFDLSFNQPALSVGKEMRTKWITFSNGEAPWDSNRRFGYGPLGICKELDEPEYSARRRTKCFELLRRIGLQNLQPVFMTLVTGRISLLN